MMRVNVSYAKFWGVRFNIQELAAIEPDLNSYLDLNYLSDYVTYKLNYSLFPALNETTNTFSSAFYLSAN